MSMPTFLTVFIFVFSLWISPSSLMLSAARATIASTIASHLKRDKIYLPPLMICQPIPTNRLCELVSMTIIVKL